MAFVFDFLGAKEYLSVWHSGRLVSTGLSSNTLTLKYLSHCSRKGSIDRKVEDATQWGSTESRIRAKIALHVHVPGIPGQHAIMRALQGASRPDR